MPSVKEIQTQLSEIEKKLSDLKKALDIDSKRSRLKELDDLQKDPDFWNDSGRAAKVMQERSRLAGVVDAWDKCSNELSEINEFLELASEDESLLDELDSKKADLQKRVDDLEFQRMLGGEHDADNAIVEINAGAGGTEAQDWCEMLLRMYLRYAEKKGFKVEMVEATPGEEAGLKGATFIARGPYAYGHLKAETGIHRLVRISPFDANKRRHTSFASVYVTPEIEDDIDIEIDEKDIRIDTYRAGGAGGQHVNKTDSAVRITHFPTGIVVQCQNERSQHKNKATAMKILRSRLYELEMRKRMEEAQKEHSQKKKIEWGSQIRSYVLQPYQMVKDHRTNHETGNVNAVLDGELDDFIRAYLLMS